MKKYIRKQIILLLLVLLNAGAAGDVLFISEKTVAEEIQIKKTNENIVDQTPIEEKLEAIEDSLEMFNSKKLFPNASIEVCKQIATQLTGDFKVKRIQAVFYETETAQEVSLTKEILSQIENIVVFFEDNTRVELETQNKEGEVTVQPLSTSVPSEALVHNISADTETYLSEYIEQTTIETLENSFGGPMTFEDLFKGDKIYSLEDVQIGEVRKIDAFQLKDKYLEIQQNAGEVAAFILASFPELNDKENLDQRIAEIVFTYTNLHRWYDYEIGNTSVADLMFAKQSFFAEDILVSDYTHLNNYMDKLNATPWAEEGFSGRPYAYANFAGFVAFEAEDSLRNERRGFDKSELAASNGKAYISGLVEYLIRTFEGTTDYDGWFTRQGFVTATSYLPNNIGASQIGQSLWGAMKDLEQHSGNQLSESYITVLLSVSDRSKVSVSNSANGIYFSNTSKQDEYEIPFEMTPEEQAQYYADNNNNLFKTFLTTGTAAQKEALNKELLKPVWYTLDAGESENYMEKDFYNKDNVYLNQFILAATLKAPNYMSRPGYSASKMNVSGNSVINMSVMPVISEFTIAHEETHRMDNVVTGGYGRRGNIEAPATFTDYSDSSTLKFNYYYEGTKAVGFNQHIPKTDQDVKNYGKNMMDLIYAWNIEKAKLIFAKPINEQLDKVYKLSFESPNKETVYTPLTQSELEGLQQKIEKTSLLETLVKENIVLPGKPTGEEIRHSMESGYSGVNVRTHSFFNYLYSGGHGMEDWTSYLNGWSQVWVMEFMGQKGMEGYEDFYSKKEGAISDKALIEKVFNKAPEEYILERYREVEQKIESNQLKGYSEDALKSRVDAALGDDEKEKRNFIKEFLANYNDLYDSIYEDKEETIAYSYFKNGYWRDYGFILEGQAGSEDMTLVSREDVSQAVELVDASGNVVQTFNGTPTNWYGDKTKFDGYQVILTTENLASLEAGDYHLQVRTQEKSSGKETVTPIKEPLSLFSFVGEMSQTIAGLEKGSAQDNGISFHTDSAQTMVMKVERQEVTFNKISQYTAASGNFVIDGWLAMDFDFRKPHTKELLVGDASGTEILRKVTPTWDITQTFKINVKEEWKRSGFQASIPADKVGKDHKYFMIVKDETGQEVARAALN